MTWMFVVTVLARAAASNGLRAVTVAALPAASRSEGVVVWVAVNAVIAIVGGLIAAAISIAVFRVRVKVLEEDMGDVKEKVDKLHDGLSALTVQRSECELRAANNFCTRNELVRLTIDAADQNEKVLDKMSAGFAGIHKRIDQGLKDVHERINLLGPEAKRKQGAPR